MTITALHPSEIRFACPPWCIRTRDEHLEDVGNHGGRVIHSSADRTGGSSQADLRWYVAISSITFPDGAPSGTEGVQVEVDTDGNICLTPDQARAMVRDILAAVEEAAR